MAQGINSLPLVTLSAEIVARLRSSAAAEGKVFEYVNMDDADRGIVDHRLPLVAVCYNSGYPKEQHPHEPSRGARTLNLFTVVFSVIIAVEHGGGSGRQDGKPVAMAMLDDARRLLLGYRSSNFRPWRLVNEQPAPGPVDGVAYYIQLWETDVPLAGDHESI